MTPERIAKLRALDAAASKPWKHRSKDAEEYIDGPNLGQFDPPQDEHCVLFQECYDYLRDQAKADFRFIEAARVAVPELLDEVERLRGALRRFADRADMRGPNWLMRDCRKAKEVLGE